MILSAVAPRREVSPELRAFAMDLTDAIKELYREKEQLDRAIAGLESLAASNGSETRRSTRGRKFMPAAERREVSERMKRYWTARRTKLRELQPTSAS